MSDEDGVTNRELARRLDRLEAAIDRDFVELRADLRGESSRFLSAERYKAESEARDARLTRLEEARVWVNRTLGTALVGMAASWLLILLKIKGV